MMWRTAHVVHSLSVEIVGQIGRHVGCAVRQFGGVTEWVGYSDKAEYDPGDLWEKMNAADRENRYNYANSRQNGFARKYRGLVPGR